jgi:hypothetical protein
MRLATNQICPITGRPMRARRGNVISLFGDAPIVPVTTTPKAGYYYLPKKGDVPYNIAKKAYKDAGLTDVKTGLFLMNDNPANAHIKKGKSGWESYKVKGLQLNPDYDSSDAQSTHGSGTGYPLVWIPPLNGATPDQVAGGGQPIPGQEGKQGIPGPQGPQGIPGPQGPQGIPGEPGHTPTKAELSSLISDFMDENPVSGKVSSQELAKAVSDYLQKNPVAQGPQGIPGPRGPQGIPGPAPTKAELSSLISDFMDENPVAGKVSSQELAKAVSDYLQKNPVAQGPQGIPGPRGPQGMPGPAPTPEQLQKAVTTYISNNPIESGGSGFDMEQARDFVDARIRIALRDLPSSSTSADFDFANMSWKNAALLLTAGVLGAAILGGMQKAKRRKATRGGKVPALV